MTVAYPTSFQPAHARTASTVLLVADTDNAVERAKRTLDSGGFSQSRTVSMAEALPGLESLAQIGLVWVELETVDERTEQLLSRVDADVRSGRYCAVVAAESELIDPVSALVTEPRIEVVIGRSELERSAALSTPSSRTRQ